LIQKTRRLESIVARAPLAADFVDSIDPKPTFPFPLTEELELGSWISERLPLSGAKLP
jgi:hypothetical protein